MARSKIIPPESSVDNAAREALGALIERYSDERAVAWLRHKFPSFAPGLAPSRGVPSFGDKNEREYFSSARLLGFVKALPDAAGGNRPLVVASIRMKRPLSERTSRLVQFSFARKVVRDAVENPPPGLAGLCAQGLFFFHDADGSFRLSFVTARIEGRRAVWSEARRHSFFCRPDRRCNTMRRRLGPALDSFEPLVRAFSVEALTKEFYEHLFHWYEWACDPDTGVSFPNRIGDRTDDRKNLPEAIIRLITRLLFVWFVRERRLVPGEIFDRAWAEANLRDFRADSMDGKHGTSYYRAVLQNLFFATLNVPPDERTWAERHRPGGGMVNDHDIRNRFRFPECFRDPDAFFAKDSSRDSLLRGVPFLNCALFDCLDRKAESGKSDDDVYLDGFSRSSKRQAILPNALFFGDGSDEEGHEGILNLLAAYDFTIDENAASDGDVALDPELLGKVFENLLGAFNPETQEAARKMTGSFYTPREIVDYMVEQSLRAHLRAKVPAAADERKLDDLFARAAAGGDDKGLLFSRAERKALLEALYSCRSLDPACGSGAFPMGMLHAMTRLLAVLDPTGIAIQTRILKRHKEDILNLSRDNRLERAEREKRTADLEKMLVEQTANPDYARKLWIIENCIYGVDIQPIAAQISKLRFFISLLCDQPDADAASFVALPNLESKFVCANTLLPLPDPGGEFDFSGGDIQRLRDELREIRHTIFQARGWKTKRKYQEKEKAKRAEIAKSVSDSLCKPDKAKIAQAVANIERLERERAAVAKPRWENRRKPVQDDLFATPGGASPPGEPQELFDRVDVNAEKRAELDRFIAENQRTIDNENVKRNRRRGNTTVEDLANLVAEWNPYDQNASASFFDPDWMFDVKDGFDIVLGNPPYFVIRNDNELKQQYEELYLQFKTGRINIYQLFFAVAPRLLSKAGLLTYIHPKTLLGDSYLAGTRKEILSLFDSFSIVNIESRTDTFEGVLQSVIVSFWSRRGSQTARMAVVRTKSDFAHLRFLDCAKESVIMPDGRILASDRKEDYTIVNHAMANCERPLVFVTGSIEWNKYKNHLSSIPGKKSARMLFGENIQRFYLAPPARRAASAFINEGSVPRLDGIAIVTQRTTAIEQPWRIIATMIDSEKESVPFVTENHTNVFVVETRNQGLYCLGVLNSRFIDYYFRLFNSNTQVSSGELNSLPFPASPSVGSVRHIGNLVNRILSAKAADPDADTAALERKIDEEVYALYGLTEGEIAIIEGTARRDGPPRPDSTTDGARERTPARAKEARGASILDEDTDIE